MNSISEQELNTVKGLMRYLNENVKPSEAQVGVDVHLTDANGESLGDIQWHGEDPGYVLTFPGVVVGD